MHAKRGVVMIISTCGGQPPFGASGNAPPMCFGKEGEVFSITAPFDVIQTRANT